MQTFKSYLTEGQLLIEGTDPSTKFEGVIVECWNNKSLSEADFKTEILKKPLVQAFLKVHKREWGTYQKGNTVNGIKNVHPNVGKILYDFSKLLKQKLGSLGTAQHEGLGSPTLGNFWKTHTGKGSDTSKADIKFGNVGVSVKGPSALIMSGEQKEAMATVKTAMGQKTSVQGTLQRELEEHVENFLSTVRTLADGAIPTRDALDKVQAKNMKKRAKAGDTFSTKEREGKGQQKLIRTDDGEDKWVVGEIDPNTSNDKIKDQLLKAEGDIKTNAEAAFNAAFKKPEISLAFALEAMTGQEKFSEKVFGDGTSAAEGEATHMLVWDYGLKKLKYTSAADMVSEVANQLKMQATIKSSSYSKKLDGKDVKLGYSIYQSFRLNVETALDDTKDAYDAKNEEIERAQNLLTEGMIDEFAFFDKIKQAWNWLKDKVTSIWNALIEKLIEIKEKVKKMWNEGVDVVMNAFEVDVGRVSVKKQIRLRV